MSNLNDPLETTGDGLRAVRVAERAGAERLGASLYELQPGDEMVFHYHVQREELLIVLEGRLSLRTADGWEELPEGEVVAFPHGECGAHGYRNDGDAPVRVLMISEMNGPNISIYPDTNQVGVFDAGQRAQRRFGALFNVADAVADYGGKAEIVPPAPGPRARREAEQRRA
ncbi:MAG: cupin domain-containing protein [Actinomycetota bacterium]|nr:cupin domain-containing protein [Actinomycetota bacterium]